MKRTLITLAALATLGVSAYVGNLWAQTEAAPPANAAQPRTRIALFNLAYIVKYYQKNTDFQKEMQAELKAFQDKHAKMTEQLKTLATEAQKKDLSAERKEAITKQHRDLERDMQDNQAEAKALVAKKGGDHLTKMYQEVYSAARRYALAHNYELVLHYNDAVTTENYNSPANIQGKMQTRAIMPIYMANGMEISQQLVKALNAGYRKTP